MLSNSQLIILGNGFDLQCGLKSSFDDFMQTRQAKFKEIVDTFQASPSPPTSDYICTPNGKQAHGSTLADWSWQKGLTIWDFLLCEDKQQRTWYDIEECIRTWVDCRHEAVNFHHKSLIEQLCMDYQAYLERYDFAFAFRKYAPSSGISSTPEDIILSYAQDFYSCIGEVDALLQMFLDQLHRYERAFAIYLQEQQKKNRRYSFLANNLLLSLAEDQISQTILKTNPSRQQYKSCSESISILSFNYTDPIKDDWKDKLTSLNIHGLASRENIIFGIDGTNLSAEQPHYADTVKFSKTYRLMALSGNSHQPLVRPYLSNPEKGATDMIKFFGHSLSGADYSYFQAIFDEVDLYESNTHLIFYYNQNRPNNETKKTVKNNAQEEMFQKVNRLITVYGQTQDNKDHGKNLLHKMLLEGRLTIKQAPISLNDE